MNQIYNVSDIQNASFPLIPLRHKVLFPGTVIPLVIGRERSVKLIEKVEVGQLIGFAVQKDPQMVDPGVADMQPVGVLGKVRRVMRTGHQRYRVLVQGVTRFRLGNLVQMHPYWMAEGELIEEASSASVEAQDLAEVVIEHLQSMVASAGGTMSDDLKPSDPPGLLADRIAASLGLEIAEEVGVLLETDPLARLKRIAELIGEVRARSEVKRDIDSQVRQKFGKSQREAVLREQLKAIKKELGEDDEEGALGALKRALDEAELPDEVQKVVEKELSRLEKVGPNQAEANVIRNYLELIAELPWGARAASVEDIDAVEQVLEEDHFGLEDVKKRILEHMAVLKISGNPRGTILCFAGPPGVGKTSLGQSIADATKRPMVRIALGGVRDEAEIRGHRRTYVGALPGRLINALRKVKVKNPVILLDEIDKLGVGWGGSPEAALLEVLDPEQNQNFLDHYLELPFDLSEVMFITTANDLSKLSAPLRDRLEIIQIEGYTANEKAQIARRHLLPRRLTEYAIPEEALELTDTAMTRIIRDYTREAGVRQLNRELTRICRALALEVARGGEEVKRHVDVEDLSDLLGKARFFDEVVERTSAPGVATGLAWTPVGGDILFIETSMMSGKGRMEITGQLGDVMKESARAALTYVRSHADEFDVDPTFLETRDLHLHVPAGAVPKDGPSAGVTIFVALTSLLTGRRVRSDTAMTGEATLRGRVLPVGGIKAKVMAAHRAGLTRVILPSRNERDVEDVPQEIREAMTFYFVEDMGEAIHLALEAEPIALGAVTAPLGNADEAQDGALH